MDLAFKILIKKGQEISFLLKIKHSTVYLLLTNFICYWAVWIEPIRACYLEGVL